MSNDSLVVIMNGEQEEYLDPDEIAMMEGYESSLMRDYMRLNFVRTSDLTGEDF